jgi:hypothetical protein
VFQLLIGWSRNLAHFTPLQIKRFLLTCSEIYAL